MMDQIAPERVTDEATATIIAFLRDIGIGVELAELPESFLPGIGVERGRLLVDPSRLAYPGDLLHEAGHLAVMPPSDRAGRVGNVGDDQGEEIVAILWSWAALLHLRLSPDVVFHAAGYRGASRWFVKTFSAGEYPGLPLLQWMGLTLDADRAAERGVPPFPHMLRWLREAPETA